MRDASVASLIAAPPQPAIDDSLAVTPAPIVRAKKAGGRRAVFNLDKLPAALRETMHWIVGRSRRKETKDQQPSVKRRVQSTSQVPPRPLRKSPSSSELCVCEAIDDHMIERIVTLPNGIDRTEWIATHTLAVFDNANALCGTVSELCTPVSCPAMSYPGTSKAHFIDEKGKRHLYPAMQYIDCVMSFCEKKSKDESLFPTRYGSTFSSEFEPHCKRAAKLLWHCLGHLYTRHWDELDALNLRPQCAMVISHLARFSHHFGLLDPKDQQMINNTVQLVRPPPPAVPKPDLVSRLSEDGRGVRVPSSKSGSWGGYPSPAVLSCKAYAQTC